MILLLRKRRIKVLACLLGLLVAALLAGWLFPQRLLCIDDGARGDKADAIVVLGGSPGERANRAAELFAQGAAPKIIVSGGGDTDSNSHLLIGAGVPASAIVPEPKSRNTKENAENSIAVLRTLGARHVIVVTSWYHSRRALRTFRHFAPDIQFESNPSYYAYSRADWSREGIRPHIRAEYLKLAYYWVVYGICPF